MAADPASEAGGDDERPGGISRRTLIRLLVGLGIGIPLLVEALTLLGLVGSQLGDGPTTETETPTPAGRRVGVGDELLPETAPTETVSEAAIASQDWTLTIAVEVENGSEQIYDVRLGTVTTADGERIEGGGGSPPLQPGESATVIGTWDLPEASRPVAVDVVAVSRNGTVTTVDETVRLGKIPVRG